MDCFGIDYVKIVSMKSFVIWGLIGVWFLGFGVYVYADNVGGYAWSETIGWIKMDGSNYGVSYNQSSDSFSGWAWSENIGWIKFDGLQARACSGAANSVSCDGGPNPLAGGWDGRISLRGSNYGVQYIKDKQRGCYLSGYAWGSDVVGWIKFSGNSYTTSIIPCDIEPEPGNITCEFEAVPTRLIRPRNDAVLNWSCQNAGQCSISGVGPVSASGGSADVIVDKTTTFTLSCANSGNTFSSSVEIQVLQPTYCEIIPQGPGCE